MTRSVATAALQRETITLPSGKEQIVYRGGQGPALLWLHALSGVDTQHSLLTRLLGSYSVVAPLAPGFDDLEDLRDINDVHELALHYDDIVQTACGGRAVVIGESFGALIALELAAHAPASVDRMVAISPIGLWNDAYPVTDLFAVPYQEMPRLLYADPETADAYLTASAAAREADLTAEEAAIEALVDLAKGMTTVAKFLWPIPDRGLAKRLYRVSAPTLILAGELDAFVPPRYADDYVALMPNASKSLIAGAGHLASVDSSEQVAFVVLSFLESAS
jgi:pimeloyl-ACP methyl ester carboxylesterase